MNLISGIDVSASALNAQKTRLDIVAQNIANAQTTRGPTGGLTSGRPFRLKRSWSTAAVTPRTAACRSRACTWRRSRTIRPPDKRVYDPQHPDADSTGTVTMPNVNLAYEMVDLITATRAYEANLSVVKSAKQMALKALEIGK